MTSELDNLKHGLADSIDSLHKWMIRLTAVIVVGLAIEFCRPLLSLLGKFDVWVLLEIIGTGLVTIGVGGQLWVEFEAHRKEQKLRSVNAEIEREAESELKARDERISLTNERAEELHKQNLELEAFLLPRRFLYQHGAEIVLSNCGPVEAAIEYVQDVE